MLLKALVLAVVALILCAVPASAAPRTIAARDNSFGPSVSRVYKGQRVVWVNRGRNYHTVTTRRWSEVLKPGERYSRRIRRGLRFVCVYHSNMTGRVACRNC
jgi:plastocyanin